MFYSLYFALAAILQHFDSAYDPPVGAQQYDCGRAVFDAWDFALSDKQAIEDNLAKIGGSFKALTDTQKEAKRATTKTWGACFVFYFRKVLGVTLSLCLVLGASFGCEGLLVFNWATPSCGSP
jgi:hypothetical protein